VKFSLSPFSIDIVKLQHFLLSNMIQYLCGKSTVSDITEWIEDGVVYIGAMRAFVDGPYADMLNQDVACDENCAVYRGTPDKTGD